MGGAVPWSGAWWKGLVVLLVLLPLGWAGLDLASADVEPAPREIIQLPDRQTRAPEIREGQTIRPEPIPDPTPGPGENDDDDDDDEHDDDGDDGVPTVTVSPDDLDDDDDDDDDERDDD